MQFIISMVLLVLFLISPLLGVLAAMVYLFYYFFSIKQQSPLGNNNDNKDIDDWKQRQLDSGDLADLMILRREIDSLYKTNILSQDEAESYNKKIDTLVEQYLTSRSAQPGNLLWQERREFAWKLLQTYSDIDPGHPPWKDVETQAQEEEAETPIPEIDKAVIEEAQQESPSLQAPQDNEIQVDLTAHISSIEELPPPPPPPPKAELPSSHHPTATELLQQATPQEETLVEETAIKPAVTSDEKQDIKNYAWQPKEPGILEKTLASLSGWHALAVPFLQQNIGWFIGVFCLIAGSVFLVSYSSGYAKNLIAFTALFIFTLFTLWGAYQIRSKRPELETSSHVIFILSILLIPLTSSTAISLIVSTERIPLLILGWALIALEIAVFYYAVTLIAALMDRSLKNNFPRFFLALSFAQLLLILLEVFPYWQILMMAHLLVFAILSYGIYLFINEWLDSIFIEQRKIAYFAAGTLIYAASIAFISLTWSTVHHINLPGGYLSLFLMLLCCLLFYIDSQLKKWTLNYAYLSRFSFFIYGLSSLSLFLLMPQQSMALVSLCLAIGLYAFIVWNYLTLIPLYIFLLCCFWLYGLVILQHFDPSMHFILAFPGLYALYKSAKWALRKKRSEHLAVIVYRMFYALLVMLGAWSLFYSQPGWLGLTTAILLCGLLYLALKSAPQWLFLPPAQLHEAFDASRYHNLLLTPWFYSISLLMVVVLHYAPIITGLQPEAQFALGLLLLTVFWSYKGLRLYFNSHQNQDVSEIEMRLNSSLLYLIIAILPMLEINIVPQLLCLIIMGTILLSLSLLLKDQCLFYLTLLVYGVSGMLIKSSYFPVPSTGLAKILLALSIWVLLWWQEHGSDTEIIALQRQAAEAKASLLPSFHLLWFWQVNSKPESKEYD